MNVKTWNIKERRDLAELLNRLYIPQYCLGRTYIISIVTGVEEYGTYDKRDIGSRYHDTAKWYCTTTMRVKRACRYAIEHGFERNPIPWKLELNLFSCPTVDGFILALFNHVWTNIAG